MIERIFHYKSYLQRHLDAPLLQEREAYIKNMYERGICRNRMLSTANYLLFFVQGLKLNDNSKEPISLEEISKCVHVWTQTITKSYFKRNARPASYNRIMNLAIDWLGKIGRLDKRYDDDSNLFNSFIVKKRQKREYIGCPFYEERLNYLIYCKDQGYSHYTLKRIAKYQVYFVSVLNDLKKRNYDMTDVELIADMVMCNPKFKIKAEYSRKHFISYVTQWLSYLGWYKKYQEESYYGEDFLKQYLKWGAENRGYTNKTIQKKKLTLKQFFTFLYSHRYTLNELTSEICDEYIYECANVRKNKRHTIAGVIADIRPFLKYAEGLEWCPCNLWISLRSPRLYKMESLPSFVPWEKVIAILDRYSKCQNPTSIRDYAILLLFSVYGLRCSEVVNLRLTDISWRNSTFTLERSKRCKTQVFPLVQIVGEALIHYIKDVRPNEHGSPTIFMSARPPYRPITTKAVYSMVRRILKNEDLKIEKYGPHSLRYSCATNLLRTNHSMKEIADLLGHRSMNTTMNYAKIDLANLKKVSQMDFEELI